MSTVAAAEAVARQHVAFSVYRATGTTATHRILWGTSRGAARTITPPEVHTALYNLDGWEFLPASPTVNGAAA